MGTPTTIREAAQEARLSSVMKALEMAEQALSTVSTSPQYWSRRDCADVAGKALHDIFLELRRDPPLG